MCQTLVGAERCRETGMALDAQLRHMYFPLGSREDEGHGEAASAWDSCFNQWDPWQFTEMSFFYISDYWKSSHCKQLHVKHTEC